jgi:hypothetical protein
VLPTEYSAALDCQSRLPGRHSVSRNCCPSASSPRHNLGALGIERRTIRAHTRLPLLPDLRRAVFVPACGRACHERIEERMIEEVVGRAAEHREFLVTGQPVENR